MIHANDFKNNTKLLTNFSRLDDYEIYSCLKYWTLNKDYVLSNLSKKILDRKILKIKIQKQKFKKKDIQKKALLMMKDENISKDQANYFIFTNKVSNSLYSTDNSNIKILFKNGEIRDLSESSDQFNLKALSKTINKYFLCSPKEYIVN